LHSGRALELSAGNLRRFAKVVAFRARSAVRGSRGRRTERIHRLDEFVAARNVRLTSVDIETTKSPKDHRRVIISVSYEAFRKLKFDSASDGVSTSSTSLWGTK
jgi:hypothetical protein